MADCKNVTPQVCGVHLLKFPSVSCADMPHFEGITNITVNQGDDIDLTDGVHAYDGNGFEIPYEVSPDTIDPCASGQFTVKYTAVGSGEGMRPTFPDCIDTANHLPCEGAETEIAAYRTVTIRSIGQPTINIESDATVCNAVTCEDSVGCPMSVITNEPFDPLEGVVARDGLGNVLPVTYSGEGYLVSGDEIYYPTAGSYTLTYSAEDACGNKVTATVGIEVEGDTHTTLTISNQVSGALGDKNYPFPFSLTSDALTKTSYEYTGTGRYEDGGTLTRQGDALNFTPRNGDGINILEIEKGQYTLTATNAQSHEESASLNGDELIVIVDGAARTTDFDVENGDVVDVTMTLDPIDPTGSYFEWEFYPTPPLPSSDAYGLRITVTNVSTTDFASSIQYHPGLANVNTGTEYDVDYALATDAHYYSTTEFTPTAADLARGHKDFRITMEATMSDSTVVTESVTYRYDLSN